MQESSENTGVSDGGGAESGALGDEIGETNCCVCLQHPDIKRVMEAWPKLAPRVRDAIITMAEMGGESDL